MKKIEIINDKITCKRCNLEKHKLLFLQRGNTSLYRGICVACSKNYSVEERVKETLFLELFLNNTKQCITCNQVKSLIDFDQDKSCRFGTKTACKDCRKNTIRLLTRKAYLKFNYKLSIEEYDVLLNVQGNACAICKINLMDLDIKEVNVDHCHATGNIRGILCRKCNLGLGNFKDNIQSLENAINYIKQYSND